MGIVLKQFTKVPNAGDLFARDIAERYIGMVDSVADEKTIDQPNVVLVGSILQWADHASVVCGAGLKAQYSRIERIPRKIIAVRGPLTRRLLLQQNIFCPDVYGDPGILANEFAQCDRGQIRFKHGVVPHYVDFDNPLVDALKCSGALIIDIRRPAKIVLSELCQCETIFSSSLHGLIFAHAIGRSALWIELSDNVEGAGFKFYDYYYSLNADPICVRIDSPASLAELAHFATLVNPDRLRGRLRDALYATRNLLADMG